MRRSPSERSAFDYSYLEECIRQQIVMVIEDWPQANDTALREFVKGLGSADGYDQLTNPQVKQALNCFHEDLRGFVEDLEACIKQAIACQLEVIK